jgi:hypothetical protein
MPARSFSTRGGNRDAKLGSDTSCRLFALRRDGPRGLPRLFHDRGRRGLGRAAIEGRLRRDVKLNGLSASSPRNSAAEAQGAIDAGGNARCKNPTRRLDRHAG